MRSRACTALARNSFTRPNPHTRLCGLVRCLQIRVWRIMCRYVYTYTSTWYHPRSWMFTQHVVSEKQPTQTCYSIYCKFDRNKHEITQLSVKQHQDNVKQHRWEWRRTSIVHDRLKRSWIYSRRAATRHILHSNTWLCCVSFAKRCCNMSRSNKMLGISRNEHAIS